MGEVDAAWTPMLKFPQIKGRDELDYEREPSLKVKIPYKEDKSLVELYDTKKEPLFPSEDVTVTPLDLIPKFSKIKSIIECVGIWIAPAKFGVTWRLRRAVVPHTEQLQKGQLYIHLSEHEIKSIENSEQDGGGDGATEEVDGSNADAGGVKVEDSDDEETPKKDKKKKKNEDSDDDEETATKDKKK